MSRLVNWLRLLVAVLVALEGTPVIHTTAQEARRPTRTVLTSTPNPSVRTQAVTLTATVQAGGSGETLPAGEIEFYAGPRLLGTAALPTEGSARTASLEVTTLPAGRHELTARYVGHPEFAPSLSPPVAHFVNAQ